MARGRRRGGLTFLLVLLVLIGAGWTACWYVASEVAARAVARAEAKNIACTDRSIGGFPLSVTVRCSTMTVRDAGSGTEIRLSGVNAAAALYWPGALNGTVDGINVSLSGGRTLPPMKGEGKVTLVGLTSALDTNLDNALRLWVQNGGGADIETAEIVTNGLRIGVRGKVQLAPDGYLNGTAILQIGGNLRALPDLAGTIKPSYRSDAEKFVAAMQIAGRPVDTEDGPAQEIPLLIRRGSILAGGIIPIGVTIPPLQP